MSSETEIEIRRGRLDDAEGIAALYNHYILETTITFDIKPHTVEMRREWLEQFSAGGRHQIFVAIQEGKLVGFVCSQQFRKKAAYDPTVETTIYLAPEAVGQGLGRRLYDVLFDALSGADVHVYLAGVTLPNPGSVALHRAMGFRDVGVFREIGRKFGSYWDVAWFERRA